ncbi:hypothetical protein HPP92_013371 [Vanilla planifolia]|uniref:Shikimate kinase n=1 Tax=Vanilla planifolia TaxID=51239 RepID=A0A835UXY0_VANPL|nr:hypothetical protein HPP92_013371 [Vanilla planifolia]
MEALSVSSYQSLARIGHEKRWRSPRGTVILPKGFVDSRRLRSVVLQVRRIQANRYGNLELRTSCCINANKGSKDLPSCVDEALILKMKSADVLPYLNQRCIYLVGMMGSGKTTIGKILSEVLGYSFYDSDKLVEQATGLSSVAEIFKEHNEDFFRDTESNILKDLSSMKRLGVGTGGGAVIRPINWRYMKQGISVWLDVPLEALAKRIAAVGTESRPLLDNENGDPYTKALIRLSALSGERGDAYANADARVCLQHVATEQGHGDVLALTPAAIATEALVQIESFLIQASEVERLNIPEGLRR